MRDRILVVCATHRDRRELARLGLADACIFHDYASIELEQLAGTSSHAAPAIRDPDEEIERLVALARRERVRGVFSTDDYPGTTLAAVVASRLGLPGPTPRAALAAQHKYVMRTIGRDAAPEATPEFELTAGEPPRLLRSGPVFVKPCKSFFSVGAQLVEDVERWDRRALTHAIPRAFFEPFDRLCRAHAGIDTPSNRLLVERLLTGRQCTVEGVRQGGRTHVLGIVDSLYCEDVRSFARFEYPSSLPAAVQVRMKRLATRLIEAVGYDDGGFNVETIWDEHTDRIAFIEVNPRSSSQFADLFEKVDGVNTYSLLVDIARGCPCAVRGGRGGYAFAASFPLRRRTDAWVEATPSPDDVARLEAEHPGLRVEVLATAGERLSDELQDGKSFRYGIVDLGGRDRRDALEKLARIERALAFRFRDLDDGHDRDRSAMAAAASARPTPRAIESFSPKKTKPSTAVTTAVAASTTGPIVESGAPFRSSAK